MTTILLVVVTLVLVMGMVGGVASMLGGDSFLGVWFAMEIVKGCGSLLGVVLSSLLESMNQS